MHYVSLLYLSKTNLWVKQRKVTSSTFLNSSGTKYSEVKSLKYKTPKKRLLILAC